MKRIILIIALSSLATCLYGEVPKNFRQARQLLFRLSPSGGTSLYCGCPYRVQGKAKRLKGKFATSCPMIQGKSPRVSWEHVVPAQIIGKRLGVWKTCLSKRGKKKTARQCAQRDANFRKITSDPYNLFPAILHLNSSRGSGRFVLSRGLNSNGCRMQVRRNEALILPHLADNIARVYLYMDHTYPVLRLLKLKERNKFKRWIKLQEANEAECHRYQKVYSYTGMKNPIMEAACGGNQLVIR